MANSRKRRSSDPAAEAARVLATLDVSGRTLRTALSGGVDSVVLLRILRDLSRRSGFSLAAIHVNHGLSPHAARWEAFCCALCARWKIPLAVARVTVPKNSGLGIEAAARAERYRAFATQAPGMLLLAHHLDDQAETLLLQLLRGAGVKGLAAMPAVAQRAPLTIVRPLLAVPRAALVAYARRHRLEWIEDESNDETALKRNFLRHRVLPEIAQAFPAYRETLSRTAAHCAEAAGLLDEIGRADLGGARRDGGDRRLDCRILRRLTPARATNALRGFLVANLLAAPDTGRIREMLRQILGARPDAQPKLVHDGAELRRFRDTLWIVPATGVPEAAPLPWKGEAVLELPGNHGALEFRRRGKGRGLSLSKLSTQPVTVQFRLGGEKIRLDPSRPRRSLKNLLQERALPPWERERLPLLYSGKMLAWVPGIGADCGFLAGAGEAAVYVRWLPIQNSCVGAT
jgi:tRNA(Ile)-lysidine synthase